MPNLSYGSITITDLTDVGQLSVYPTSNMPNTIIYNEDENSFTPNWANSSSHLELNPVIYYAGDSLAPNASGVTVVWSKKIDIGAATTITTNSSTGQSINTTTKKLTVSKNPLGTNNTTVCYIVTVTYVEPSTQKTLRAEGQITFSLLKQVSTAKTCSIIGDNIFKYDESRNIKGATSITLTASYKNVNITDWQYLNSSGNWVRHSNFSSSDLEHLTISHTDAGFINDRLSIKLVTSDNDTYDIHTIMKLYDGVPGTSTIAGVLSNEDQMIACQSDGTPISYDGAESYLTIYEGGTDVTSQWSISIQASNGITFNKSISTSGTPVVGGDTDLNGTTYRYVKVTGFTADTGNITFTASKSGYNDIVKVFSIIKMKTGQDGYSPTIYYLRCGAVAVNKAATTNTFNPSSVTINAFTKTGNTQATYAGRFVVTAGNESIYTSGNNESSCTLTSTHLTNAVSNKFLTVELYLAGGTTTKVDSQTITITTDGPQGPKGEDGDDGKGAINVILGNQAAVIPCTSGNATVAATTILIPFIAYQGTEPVECNVDSTALTAIASTSPTVTKQGTAANSYEGLITYSIAKSKSVSAASGEVTLKFTVTDKDSQTHIINQKFSWTRSTAATNGVNAVLLQLSTPSGNIFYKNSAETLTIVGTLTDGATDKTSSVTAWVWSKYVPGTGYQTDNSSTTNTITVSKDSVNGYVSYKCQATYGGKNYIQYYSLLDWTDPLQIAVFCSFGDQITNGQGVGALYVIVTQGNEEVDAIKTKTFSETAPSNPATGAYYYQLNKTNKTVKLMKYSGSTWEDVTTSEPYSGTYTWSFRDKDGNELTTTLANDKKVIYIDGSFIDKKIIADVAVTL